MVAAVLFFGLLGTAISAAGSLMSASADARIPERVANRFVTSSRALFGAGAGLAGYAFYQSKVLDIRVGSDTVPSGALAVAFWIRRGAIDHPCPRYGGHTQVVACP